MPPSAEASIEVDRHDLDKNLELEQQFTDKMVKIAIAGGSSNVASEIIDVLVATGKHEILLLSRKEASTSSAIKGTTWIQVDYRNQMQLTHALEGVHTLLSFVAEQEDPNSLIQKNLIKAAIEAGVKRFAPSEWATSGIVSWYSYKAEIRRYLQEINKEHQVIEYTLFQCGLFLNYLTRPYNSAKHLWQIQTPFDFDQGRCIIAEGGNDSRITLTTVQDLAQVVARAIDYEHPWPVVGGISGVEMSLKQMIELGEKIRGKPFKVEELPISELEDGTWKSSWTPKIDHPAVPPQKNDELSRLMVSEILRGISAGDFLCSDEWNKLLPDFEFTQAEEFLSGIWKGKP
ncbi:NAD(P)-binding protein, partial [Aureobasidium melanogenum]